MDEFWSFIQKKSNQRWTWYAIERTSGCILAWHNGKRQDKDFLILLPTFAPCILAALPHQNTKANTQAQSRNVFYYSLEHAVTSIKRTR
jgi:IS1 family transposase